MVPGFEHVHLTLICETDRCWVAETGCVHDCVDAVNRCELGPDIVLMDSVAVMRGPRGLGDPN